MNGTAHATIGAASGFIVANTLQTSPSSTLILVGLGGVSSLVPDLDIDGKLRGKITLPPLLMKSVAQLVGIFMIICGFYNGTDSNSFMKIASGLVILTGASMVQQKHMLILTGICTIITGFSLHEGWLTLLGIYIVTASFVSHRSYTHSILGVIFFAVIAAKLEASVGIAGVYYTCIAGYISHLIADSKRLPFNKRGIQLLFPISSKEW